MGRKAIQVDLEKFKLYAEELRPKCKTQNELNQAISDKFAAEGITISPQVVYLRCRSLNLGRKKKILKIDLPAHADKYNHLLNNITLKKRVKLQCLDCTNYQPKEIKLCEIQNCVWHDIRPYQQKGGT